MANNVSMVHTDMFIKTVNSRDSVWIIIKYLALKYLTTGCKDFYSTKKKKNPGPW